MEKVFVKEKATLVWYVPTPWRGGFLKLKNKVGRVRALPGPGLRGKCWKCLVSNHLEPVHASNMENGEEQEGCSDSLAGQVDLDMSQGEGILQ